MAQTRREASRPPVAGTFWRLARYARPYAGILAVAIACSALYAGARSARAYLIKPLLDDVVLPQFSGRAAEPWRWVPDLWSDAEAGGASAVPTPPLAARDGPEESERFVRGVRENARNLLLTCLLVILVIPLSHFGQLYLVEYALGRVLVDVQQSLCSKLLSLPLGIHQGMARGETLSRTINDATRAHRALDLIFADVAQSLLALLVGALLLILISWQLALATLVVAPPVVGVIALFGRRIRKTARRRQESLGDVTQRLVEILSGIKVIKAFRAQTAEEASFRRENLRYFRRSMKVVKNRAISRTLVEGMNNAIAIGVLILGAIVLMLGIWELTPGSLAAFAAVMQTTYRPMKDLTKGWTHLMEAIPSAERFFELLDTDGESPDAPDAIRIDGVHQGIRIAGLSFSYGREPVLRDVSVDVKAGETVAVVGRTGAGKTTLADLLLRFYDPDAGSIEIDGVDLRRIARSSLLDQIAVVTQEPLLFAGTIRDNVRYGRPDASDEEIEAAARAAHVLEFADDMPRGLETEVGESGVQLSGGQRQRVAIARALAKNPAILVFDEATSSLDAKSERYVRDAIARLLRGRTVFVIAHRLSTIRHADRIVVLERGGVAAVGNHDDLMARRGLYRELVALQSEAT